MSMEKEEVAAEMEVLDAEELLRLLEEKKYSTLVRRIDDLNPVDVAEVFMQLPPKGQSAIFRLLKKDTAAEIFAELDSDVQLELINGMTEREAGGVLDELFLDDAVDLLSEMPANVVKRLLRTVDPQMRDRVNQFLSYPEDSAGSLMTAEFLEFHRSMTCAEAIDTIRRTGVDKETVYVAYVTDATRHLEGWVELQDLLFAPAQRPLSEIMDTQVIYARTHDSREQVTTLVSKYDLLALPVVDSEDRLVGIVTVDDAIDAIVSEAGENMEIIAAISPSDKPYMRTTVWETFLKRIPWLLLLMLSATFTGAIITHYEEALGHWIILTAFMPMLMGTGGNAGSQSSIAIIRALSLGEITLSDVLRVAFKEFRVSLICAAAMGLATFAKVLVIDLRLDMSQLPVALVVSISLMLTVVLAKLIGAVLPMLAKRIKLDPAVMASPFITTIVDALSLVLYFEVASRMLGM